MKIAFVLPAMLLGAANFAAAESSLPRIFPQQAEVYATGAGMTRLELPPPVLSACEPDLSDLRLFDLSGKELPFVLDSGGNSAASPPRHESIALTVESLDRREAPAFGQASGRREEYLLAIPEKLDQDATWQLRIESDRRDFVREIAVFGLRAGGAADPLVDNQAIFALAARGQRRTSVALPGLAHRQLEVVIEGEEPSFLEPKFWLEREVHAPAPPALRTELSITDQRTVGGTTELMLARPGAIVPDALVFATSTHWFDRLVTVWEQRPGRPERRLGGGRLRRVPGGGEVELTIGVAPAEGGQLRVEIENGDSPELDNLVIAAALRRPSLLFVPAALDAEGRAGLLRFGGGQARRPAYDVARLLGPITAPTAPAGSTATDTAGIANATLGPIEPNPDCDHAPALAFGMHAGAVVDTRLYSHHRRIAAKASPQGLTRVPLEPYDIAVARPDLADLRIVDGEQRQWPFLVIAGAMEVVPLQVQVELEGRESRYLLVPPSSPFVFSTLTLASPAALVDRPYRLLAVNQRQDDRVLARGRLLRRPDRDEELRISLEATRCDALALEIDNGEQAPLALRGASLVAEFPHLYLVAPAGEYTLLVGYPDASPPSYEIEQARAAVLAVRSGEAERQPLRKNSDYSQSARLVHGKAPRQMMHQVVIWTALVLAVAVLGGITLKMVRREA
ncbi:MAG TPA: hypothetical protein VEB21_10835 [Terriglobales bacterium]|nr:hypothetical protein [Terriglobales bacterium]